jgi:hypothetical protein
MKLNIESRKKYGAIGSERLLIEHHMRLKGIQKQLSSVLDQLVNVQRAYDELIVEFRKQRHKEEVDPISLIGVFS